MVICFSVTSAIKNIFCALHFLSTIFITFRKPPTKKLFVLKHLPLSILNCICPVEIKCEHTRCIKGLIIWSFFIPGWSFNSVCRVGNFTFIFKVSSQDENFKILTLMKIIFRINGIFWFYPRMKLKLRFCGEKWCFIRDENCNSGLVSRDEIFNFLHAIVICFLYWKQWQGKMKFQLGCIIIISSRDEISHYIQPLRKANNFIDFTVTREIFLR